jgi:hypothetical protein
MRRREAFEENGFAVLHGLFPPKYLDRLLEQINGLSPRRSRAGIRHALHLPPVEELAKHQVLMELAVELLGAEAFPYRAKPSSTSHRRRIGWLFGIRTPHCRCGLARNYRAGDRGRSKKGFVMRTLLRTH